jgi:hypothetical protein
MLHSEIGIVHQLDIIVIHHLHWIS